MSTIVNPDRPFLQLLSVRSALLVMAKTGLRNSRYSGKELLAIASKHTGVPYRRGQYLRAATDLGVIRDAILNQPVRLNATSDI